MFPPFPDLLQLRSTTSLELGCDPHGYSRAGYDTTIWYCAIAVGRLSPELNKMREVCLFFCLLFFDKFYGVFHNVVASNRIIKKYRYLVQCKCRITVAIPQ